MANWQGAARTNYFRVKNVEEFKGWAGNLPNIEVAQKDEGFMLMSTCPDTGSFPSQVYDEETGDEIDIELREISQFLAEGQVAVFMEAGAEKLRYVTGWAMAVSWDGQVEFVNIDEIYERAAAKFGVDPSTISNCSF